MKKIISVVLISVLLLFICDYADAKVKIYLDDSRTEYIKVDTLDCNVYEGKAGITIGFKAGNMLFSIGPEVTLGQKNSIKWDRMVQEIIARYKELCTRFNSGSITMKGYKERLKEIDGIAMEAAEFQEKILGRVRDQSKEAFNELAKDTRGEDALINDRIDKDIDDISKKVDSLKEPK
ncbi:MAG: hypothetical protein HY757_00530 [Nitrospirae bacterium]|nr:hypothetical protein [Nitrospirota bacterium]